jgi:hypothetical protein
MAGESAKEATRRRRLKAENRRRSATAAKRGIDGEQATAEALAALPTDDWTVFHDIMWPGREYANVDHVVVGPGGVFVIDSKSWSGDVRVRRDIMRQNGRLRDKALTGAGEAAAAIGSLVPGVDPSWVQPVLCFAREESIMGWGRKVMVCSTATLAPMLLTYPMVLGPAERRMLARDLGAWVRAVAEIVEAPVARKTPPRHSAATSSPAQSNHRSGRRTRRSSRTAGALLPVGAVGVGAAVMATNHAFLTHAGHLLTRVFG